MCGGWPGSFTIDVGLGVCVWGGGHGLGILLDLSHLLHQVRSVCVAWVIH